VRLRFVCNRRARRYILRLRPDGTARVTVPRGGALAEAKRFAERNVAWLENLPVRRVTMRNQRSRWGSCLRRGTISLNWRLVQAPGFVRDYIVLHELAHLKEMNHSRRFWGEVARPCPDFPAAERWLKQHSSLLA
jgi:predicted metal-dependent hydrolase